MSALSKQFVAVKQEHGGCPGLAVVFRHVLPKSQGAYDALALKVHSQLGGANVMLHIFAVSGHDESSVQEHAGCPGFSVVFTHTKPTGHASNVGALKLHPHIGGLAVVLHVSALDKH